MFPVLQISPEQPGFCPTTNAANQTPTESAIVLLVGAACTLLLSAALFPLARAWQDAGRPAVSQREKPSYIASAEGSLLPTAASDTADAPEGPPPHAGSWCEQQTWPYVDQRCRGAQSDRQTRAVRVISMDRTAPSTLMTVVPSPPPGAPSRTTDGLSHGQASVALPEPVHAPPPAVASTRDQPRSRRSPSRRDTTSAALGANIPGHTAADDDGYWRARSYASPGSSRVPVHRKPIHREPISEAGDRAAKPASRASFSYNPGATGH